MISPKKSVNNLDNINKYKPLSDAALKKLQTDLEPILKDKNLALLKLLINKYESYSPEKIETILFSNIRLFQTITQHKIRDFVTRRLRNEKKNNIDVNTIYQSDDSNLVSPYSRDSFSSRSEINLSPNMLSSLKGDIANLWQYPKFQKEICQLLWNKGDLELSSNNEIIINFENLKPMTLSALQEFINTKNRLIENYLSNDDVKIIHDVFMEGKLNDDKINEIYKVIRKRETIDINESGIFTFDVTSLKPETVTDLIRLLRPSQKIDRPLQRMKKPPTSSQQIANQPVQSGSTINQIKSNQVKPLQEIQSRFGNDQLRYLSNKIKECINNESISDIWRIVKENETVDQQGGEISLNVKKMKDVTISKLFKFIDSIKN